MSITHRVRRLLVAGVAGAMVLSLMPAGIAAADEHDDPCDGAPETEFTDSDSISDAQAANVQCMAAYGITAGFADGSFGPGLPTTRQQMASFIARLATQALNGDLEIPTDSPDVFDDVDASNTHFAAINWLAELGITEGVTDTVYNPSGDVTRQQMASFIARAHAALGVFEIVDLEQAIEDFEGEPFSDIDDASDAHRANIEALQAVGVIGGFTDGTYRPADDVTRQQMSRFIVESIRVLDSVGLWNGQFIGVTPPPLPPVVTPTYELDLSIDPAEPDTATTVTFTTMLSVDDEDLDVSDNLMQFAIFGGVSDITTVVNLETGEVDVDAIFVDGSSVIDEDGMSEFPFDAGDIPVGTHTALAWAAEDEPVFNAGEALAFDFLVFTMAAGEAPDPDPEPDAPDRDTFTEAPELVSVLRLPDGIVRWRFSEPIPGIGVTQIDLGDFLLYNANGSSIVPQEASIDNDTVVTRYGDEDRAAAANRAGVRTEAVADETGLRSLAGDFPLRGSEPVPAQLVPDLVNVDNYQFAIFPNSGSTQQLVYVDFTFLDPTGAVAATINASGDLATDWFRLYGRQGQQYDVEGGAQDAQAYVVSRNEPFTVVKVPFGPSQLDVPQQQLRRGAFSIDRDDFLEPVLGPLGLSDELGDIEDRIAPLQSFNENLSLGVGAFFFGEPIVYLLETIWTADYAGTDGLTVDPNLESVEQIPGTVDFRFTFNEPVDIDFFEEQNFYVVTSRVEFLDPDDVQVFEVFRNDEAFVSVTAGDGSRVVVARFDPDDFAGEPVAGFVPSNTVLAVDSVDSDNAGWNRAGAVAIELPPAGDLAPGETLLFDLVSVERFQNQVTGRFEVAFTFDQAVLGTVNLEDWVDVIEFNLYDRFGTRFPIDTDVANINVVGATVTFPTAGAQSLTDDQVEATVTATVQGFFPGVVATEGQVDARTLTIR